MKISADYRMVPQQIPIGLLVQLCNADTIFVCRDVLCHNVHSRWMVRCQYNANFPCFARSIAS